MRIPTSPPGVLSKSGRSTPTLALLLSAFIFLHFSGTSVAQTNHEPSTAGANIATAQEPAKVQQNIEDLDRRIAASRASENLLAAQQAGVGLERMAERTQMLEAFRSSLERLKTELEKRSLQAEEAAALEKQLEDPREARVSDPPPYNLSFYDSLLDQLAAIEQQKTAASVAQEIARRNSETLADRQEKTRQRARSLDERLGGNLEHSERQALAFERSTNGIEEELLASQIAFEQVLQENLASKIDLLQLEADIARKKIDWVVSHLHYDEKDLQKHLDAIRSRQKNLEAELQAMAGKRDKIDASLRRMRNQAPQADMADAKMMEAKVRELQAWRELYQTELEMTGAELQLLEERQRLWKTRYSAAKGAVSRPELIGIREGVASRLDEVGKQIGLEHRRRDAIRSRLGLLQSELENPETPENLKPVVESTISALRRLEEVHGDYISALLDDEQLRRRILEETAPESDVADFTDSLIAWAGRLKEIWSFEVWVIDNNPVTVRELALALLVLVVGIIAVKLVFRKISRKIFAMANLKETTAAAITKLFLYSAYVLVALLALRLVNIPLAAFAFLGGAIAIGVGFGAQNLINNFISGFIMMAERPIAIGDLIEVDGILGKVEDIGARSTRIRTGRNIHILVPNSSFLENNIVNWTHSDEKIRAKVTVGVTYGSSVTETRRLLLQAVKDTPDIFQAPAPFVIFEDFGDNALIFEVHFWVRVSRPTEQRIIESNVRFRIDKLFSDAGLVIAFPQRDVHLDTSRPLELKITRTPASADGRNQESMD